MDNCEFVNHYDQIYTPDCPSLDELTKPRYSLVISPGEKTFQRSLSSSESYSTSSYPILTHQRNSDCTTSSVTDPSSHDELSEIFDRPTKQIKLASSSTSTQATSYYANLISFANSTQKRTTNPVDEANQGIKHEEMNSDGSNNGIHSYYAPKETKRSPTLAKDHVIAERKRREKLNEKFIALSAIVPGLKKLDKASVIGDAIRYLKQLEEHVKSLEEQVKRKPAESVYKSQLLSVDDDSSSCDGNSAGSCVSEGMPQIEARVVDRDVLIRIHSKKKNGFLVKLLMELQKVHLTVVNSSVLPFGEFAMDITIVAQMDDEYSMTMEDLATSLRSATCDQFIS